MGALYLRDEKQGVIGNPRTLQPCSILFTICLTPIMYLMASLYFYLCLLADVSNIRANQGCKFIQLLWLVIASCIFLICGAICCSVIARLMIDECSRRSRYTASSLAERQVQGMSVLGCGCKFYMPGGMSVLGLVMAGIKQYLVVESIHFQYYYYYSCNPVHNVVLDLLVWKWFARKVL